MESQTYLDEQVIACLFFKQPSSQQLIGVRLEEVQRRLPKRHVYQSRLLGDMRRLKTNLGLPAVRRGSMNARAMRIPFQVIQVAAEQGIGSIHLHYAIGFVGIAQHQPALPKHCFVVVGLRSQRLGSRGKEGREQGLGLHTRAE